MWEPKAGDLAYPQGKTDGCYVRVMESQEDFVKFVRFDPKQEPAILTNRLSTFIQRYEPLADSTPG